MSDNYVRVLITDLAHCRLVIVCKSFKNSRGFITLTYNYAIALLRRRDHFCRRGASHCKAGDAHAPCVENKSTHRKFRRDGSEVRSPPHGRSCTVRLFPGMRRSYARNHRRRRGECTRETLRTPAKNPVLSRGQLAVESSTRQVEFAADHYLYRMSGNAHAASAVPGQRLKCHTTHFTPTSTRTAAASHPLPPPLPKGRRMRTSAG